MHTVCRVKFFSWDGTKTYVCVRVYNVSVAIYHHFDMLIMIARICDAWAEVVNLLMRRFFVIFILKFHSYVF